MEENTIFNEEEFRANEAKKTRLEELIRSGDAILMAGAGVTANLYCSWPQLIEKFQQITQELIAEFQPRGEKEDFLQFIDRVKTAIGDDRYYSLVYDEFKDKQTSYDEFHKTIVKMPFRGFTTTNYDHVLDNALQSVTGKTSRPLYIDKSIQKREILEFIKSLNYNSEPLKRVMHLHGSYAVTTSIILSQTEYQSKYGFALNKPFNSLLEDLKRGEITQSELEIIKLNHGLEWTMHRKLLWAVLATRRVVFMGFSVTDPYFEKMLLSVRDDLNTFNDDIHYVILRTTLPNKVHNFDFAKKLKKEYGLETVFFPDDETYSGFGRFISDLGERTIPSPLTSPSIENLLPPDSETQENRQDSNGIMELLKRNAEAINKEIRNEN